MLSDTMQKALNAQINEELYSAYLYYSMSAYMHSLNLEGMANWMKIQAQEELFHVSKFYDFVNDRGGRVILDAIRKPQSDWDSPVAAFEDTLKHERYISGKIHELVTLSVKENDHAANTFLQWFVTEQVEEEATAEHILEKMRMVGNQGMGLFMMDQELGKRVFAPPATGA